ncbi:hypothetical protein D3C81_527340 [compost metagenome]
MLLFLDCEWADVLEAELVSLALVGEDESRVFYAEREVLPMPAPPFVQKVVYPLLDRGTAAMSNLAFTEALREFFDGTPDPLVIADYSLDFELLRWALSGTGVPVQERNSSTESPKYKELLASSPALLASIEAKFSAVPSLAARRHHALVDAQVLRQAWLSLERGG